MQIVINISKENYSKVKDGRCPVAIMRDVIMNGTVLHGNATNGDMIKAMFNVNVEDDFCQSIGIKLNDSNYVQFNKDWWDAPYERK